MIYTLKHRDVNLIVFEVDRQNIEQGFIDKKYVDLIPLPLKRLIKDGYKEEFVESETDMYYVLNEEGCILLDEWLSDREIPITRDNYQMYISHGKNARQWLFENNGFSFTDCYWIESEEEALRWDDIKNKLDNLDTFYNVKTNGIYNGHNATLGGQLEKYWFKDENKVHLCKKHSLNLDILSVREVIASLIYKKQKYDNYCHYDFIYHHDGKIAGCVCDSFTSQNIELISAYDLLSEYNMTQVDDVWEKILCLAEKYGLDKQITRDYMDIQTMVDFLITNRDRHQRNIAFLRDADTLQIISPAPIFDNGSSAYYEGEKPEGLFITTVNGLYKTEMECLQHVSNFNLLNIDRLPSREVIAELYNRCENLAPSRKEFLLNMYESKKNLLAELQRQYQLGADMKEFIKELVQEDQKKNQNADIFDLDFE